MKIGDKVSAKLLKQPDIIRTGVIVEIIEKKGFARVYWDVDEHQQRDDYKTVVRLKSLTLLT